jgi:hypothetical protein
MSYRQVSVKLESGEDPTLRLTTPPAAPDKLFAYTTIVMHQTSTGERFLAI